MSWQLWPKTDDRGLARYVLPEAATRLPIRAMPERIPQDPASRLALVQAIYTALTDRGITYRAEDYQTDLARQSIRHPDAVLDGPKVGTCLDLVVLFSGICLWHDLLPVIVVLDDHAFAAVSLRHNRRDWDSRARMDRALFADGVLRGDTASSTASLLELIDEAGGSFLPLECTGFSRAADLSDAGPEGRGRENGVLPFARAIAAAHEHLATSRRRLLFAIDVAALHYTGYQPPPPWGDAPGRADIQVYTGASAQRVNYRQETTDIIQYYAARFVGREVEQQAVFDFCGAIGPFGDRSYLLIEAPGGLGKSALMVNLLLRATTGRWGGPAPHVLFFFVRRQGGRNTLEAFLRALNSQLLAHLGVSGGIPLSPTELKDQFMQLWDEIQQAATAETPLVILIDGLDEMAAGDGRETIADVLPAPRNPAIRIVVSSRPQPSARELGRREHPIRSAGVLQLKNLDRHGVQLLFEQVVASPPPPGGRKSTIAPESVSSLSERVFALTAGEPLFARAVCEEVAREGAGALDVLEHNPPRDAEGYFRLEIAALRDSDVAEEAWQILGLLTAAVGPLSRDELASLSQVPPRRISRAMAGVMRYLLGAQRYELMHPRLRDLLTGEFSDQERAEYARRIIEWMAGYRERGWPDDTPLYLLDHGAEHLAATGHRSELFALIDRRWMERQRSRESKGELTAFVRDVSRATTIALNPASRDWMAAFKGTYVLATVRSLASSLPPRLIAFLARAGAAAEALSYAELVENPVQRCEVCARLASVALARQHEGEARRLITEAIAALTGPRTLLGELDEAYEPLCEVVVSLRDIEGLDAAHRVVEQMEMDDWRAAALASVASACSQLGQVDRAVAIVAGHHNIARFLDRTLAIAALRKDDTLLRAIADLEVSNGDPAGIARQAAACHLLGDGLRSHDLAAHAIALAARRRGRVGVWASLVTSFQQSGMTERVDEVQPRLVERARQGVTGQDDDGLEETASALALTGYTEGLAALVGEMAEWRDEAVLTALAAAFARAGDPLRAREIAGAIASEDSDGSYESSASLKVVEGLVRAGLLDAARDAATDNRYESRVQGLAVVVDALSLRDGSDTVMMLARRAVADASGLSEEFGQATAYASLARLMAERGNRADAQRMLDRAESEVAATPPGGMVLGTSHAIAIGHARLGAFDRAADRFSSWRDNAPALSLLLGQMRAIGPSAAADAVEAQLRHLIADGTDHQTLLVGAEFARSAGDLDRMRELFEKARAAAEDDEVWRITSVCEVVKAMAESGETEAARRLLETVQGWPEWSNVLSEQQSDRPELDEANQETAAAEDAEEEAAEKEGEEEDEERGTNTREMVALAQAFASVDERERSDELFERAIAMARTDEDYWLGADVVEAFVRYLARTGTLADRVGDIVATAMRQTHDWEKAQQLAAGASAAMSTGHGVVAEMLLERALDCAASGGRTAFFEILERFSGGLGSLGVADIESQLFEMCEEVDAWWMPDGNTST